MDNSEELPLKELEDSADGSEEELVDIQLRNELKDHCHSSDDGGDFELTLDGAFERAGLFGRFQKRFFLLELLYQFPATFNTLAIAFVGLTPQWKCSEGDDLFPNSTSNDSSSCNVLDTANCTPEYTDRFYSIAQEVKNKTCSMIDMSTKLFLSSFS